LAVPLCVTLSGAPPTDTGPEWMEGRRGGFFGFAVVWAIDPALEASP
jgi:hypothetical protein